MITLRSATSNQAPPVNGILPIAAFFPSFYPSDTFDVQAQAQYLQFGVIGTYAFNFTRSIVQNFRSYLDQYKQVKLGPGSLRIRRIDNGSNTLLLTQTDTKQITAVQAGPLGNPVYMYYLRLRPEESSIMYANRQLFMDHPRLKKRLLKAGKTLTFRFQPPRLVSDSTYTVLSRDGRQQATREVDNILTLHKPGKSVRLGWFDATLVDQRTSLYQGPIEEPPGIQTGLGGSGVLDIMSSQMLYLFETTAFAPASLATMGVPADDQTNPIVVTPMSVPRIWRTESCSLQARGMNLIQPQTLHQSLALVKYPISVGGPAPYLLTSEVIRSPYVTGGFIAQGASFATGDNFILNAAPALGLNATPLPPLILP